MARITQESTIAYGSPFLTDDSPSNDPYIGGWDRKSPFRSRFQEYLYKRTPAAYQDNLISDLPEKKESYTQRDLLDHEDDQVKDLIFRIRILASKHSRGGLARRLVSLFDDAKQEDLSSPGIDIGSFRNFFNFLQTHSNIRTPVLSLTPENNIYASWRDDRNWLFDVHFLPTGEARFVIFTPNERHPGQEILISGTATSDTLMETAVPNDIWDWLLE